MFVGAEIVFGFHMVVPCIFVVPHPLVGLDSAGRETRPVLMCFVYNVNLTTATMLY
jgi:hypothetical protein